MQHKTAGICSALSECRTMTSKVGSPWEKPITNNFIHMSKTIPSIATKFFLPESTCVSLNAVCSPACSAENAIYLLKQYVHIWTDPIIYSRAGIYKFLVVYQCFLFPLLLKDIVLYYIYYSMYTILIVIPQFESFTVSHIMSWTHS